MKRFNVYFKSPSKVELIDTFETSEEAIETANHPGLYYSKEISNDQTACIEVTDSITGEQLYQTLTEEERELTA